MKKFLVVLNLVLINLFFLNHCFPQGTILINYYKAAFSNSYENVQEINTDSLNLFFYVGLKEYMEKSDVLFDSRVNRQINKFIEAKDEGFNREIKLNRNFNSYFSILIELINENNKMNIRCYLFNDINNNLHFLEEKELDYYLINSGSFLKSLVQRFGKALLTNIHRDSNVDFDDKTKFDNFIYPYVLDYEFQKEQVKRDINKTPSKLFYSKNVLNSIPRAYQYYLSSDYYSRLRRLNIKLNIAAEEQYEYCQDIDEKLKRDPKKYREYKRFCEKHNKQKEKYQSYIHSRAFLRTITLFAEYEDMPTKRDIDSVYDAAIELQRIFDTAYISEKEVRMWNKFGLDFYEEKDFLIQQIKDEKYISSYIEQADVLVKAEQFTEAIKLYEYCFNHFRDERVREKIDKTIKKKNDLYTERVKIADSLNSIDSVEIAIEYYKKALDIFPYRKYPKEQLKILNKPTIEKIEKEYAEYDEKIQQYLQKRFNMFAFERRIPVTYVNVFRSGKNGEKINIELSPVKNMPYKEILKLDFDEFTKLVDNTYIKNLNISQFRLGAYKFYESEELNEYISDMVVEIHKDMRGVIKGGTMHMSFYGNSDGTPYNGKLRYDKKEIGDIDEHLVCGINKTNCEKFKDLLDGNSDQKNKALAYLRAYYFKRHIDKELPGLIRQKEIFGNASKEKGGHKRFAIISLEFELDRDEFIKKKLNEK